MIGQVFRIDASDPLAGRRRRLSRHILACSVARAVVESQIPQWIDLILPDVEKLARPRGTLRLAPDRIRIFLHPATELSRLAGIRKNEHRRPLHVSSTTVAFTPPHSVKRRIPRL